MIVSCLECDTVFKKTYLESHLKLCSELRIEVTVADIVVYLIGCQSAEGERIGHLCYIVQTVSAHVHRTHLCKGSAQLQV